MKNISNGPGKLCRALAVDRSFDYASLLGDQLYICEQIGGHKKQVEKIVASKRIGIDYAEEAVDFLWRFTDE
ncbi:3-methyladenine DNA glycosylase II [Obesumbacterium proteus ATCC 12841]|uniref:3-methyladenine DNA glycosylase II n=1 Tax=Obesumbacterium proteus ATCC 12841 TaxID=1354268 RepID=A0AA91EFI5_9GAMM|nr:DNA-3-methyladenine glycosylase [Obesumbacterium proteus]OAT59866.1 3-methyladenine DNA glycosylase II [Obesumbacterium proteus ATCC 12841]